MSGPMGSPIVYIIRPCGADCTGTQGHVTAGSGVCDWAGVQGSIHCQSQHMGLDQHTGLHLKTNYTQDLGCGLVPYHTSGIPGKAEINYFHSVLGHFTLVEWQMIPAVMVVCV